MTINYIPKVIHLIDITGTGKLEQATKYSMALKKFASDYEIKVWTNDNFIAKFTHIVDALFQ